MDGIKEFHYQMEFLQKKALIATVQLRLLSPHRKLIKRKLVVLCLIRNLHLVW